MNKTWLIVQREYFSRVRKKSFLLTTILVPLVIIGFYAVIIAISISDNSDVVKVAVLDEANLFNNNLQKSKDDVTSYEFVKSGNEQAFKSKYKAAGYDFFLYVPKINIENPSGIRLHSESAVSLGTKKKIEKTINQAIETKRLGAANISAEQYKAINADISLQNIIDSGAGEKKSVAGVAYIVSFGCGVLIYMILMIYGTMVMRGVMEEKQTG